MSDEPAGLDADPSALLDIRVVSIVSDDETVWNARAEYDMEPFSAIGMMLVALVREVAPFVGEVDDDDD